MTSMWWRDEKELSCKITIQDLLLWDPCHELLNGDNELTKNTEQDKSTVVLTGFDLLTVLISENIFTDETVGLSRFPCD